MSDSPYMTVGDVATELNVSRMTVYRLIHDGQLRASEFGHNIRVHRGDLETYLERSVRP